MRTHTAQLPTPHMRRSLAEKSPLNQQTVLMPSFLLSLALRTRFNSGLGGTGRWRLTNYASLRACGPSPCSSWLSESLCLNARECKETETEDESFSRWAGPLPRLHRETSQRGVLPPSCGREGGRDRQADSSQSLIHT